MENHGQQFGRLIEWIYDSVQDTQKIVPVMQMMCQELGAIAAHYVQMDLQRREVIASCVIAQECPTGDGDGRHFREDDSEVDEHLAWLATGARGEFLSDCDGRHMTVGGIAEDAGQAEAIVLLRPAGAAPYGEREDRFLHSLSPHLTRAASLRVRLRHLERQQSVSASMVADLPYGTMWVNLAGRIVAMSARAGAMLAVGDGLCIRDDHLMAQEPGIAEKLALALQAATGDALPQGQWFALKRRRQALPLLVSVLPASIPQALDPWCGGPFALLILQDITRQRLASTGHLQEIYRFTPAEQRLAQALLENQTIESYSLQSGVSRNTVRTHLASLFAKTGTRRQAELIGTLLASQPQVPV